MSSVTVAIGSVVGAVFSLFFGTPKGPEQKLGEIAQQTAKEGEPRQIVFGIVRPIGGNVVAVQEPPRIERRKQKSNGKGGGGSKSSSTVEVPRRTYAIGICEGPVTGIRRAWRNNKLVYDARGTEWGRKNNGTFLARFQFYFGSFEQLPSPSLEAIFGAGQVPAMRGTCYMVAKDEDLKDTGGALPQWIFEVERAYGYGLTSRPYPIEDIQSSDSAGISVDPNYFVFSESTDSLGGAVSSGSFRSNLVNIASTESTESLGGAVSSGSFASVLVEIALTESSDSLGGQLSSGAFRAGLITYTRYPSESTDSTGGAVTGGSHATN
jgi:hypothetical protein